MNKFTKELIESLTEACEHAGGKESRVRVRVMEMHVVKSSKMDRQPTKPNST